MLIAPELIMFGLACVVMFLLYAVSFFVLAYSAYGVVRSPGRVFGWVFTPFYFFVLLASSGKLGQLSLGEFGGFYLQISVIATLCIGILAGVVKEIWSRRSPG